MISASFSSASTRARMEGGVLDSGPRGFLRLTRSSQQRIRRHARWSSSIQRMTVTLSLSNKAADHGFRFGQLDTRNVEHSVVQKPRDTRIANREARSYGCMAARGIIASLATSISERITRY